MKTTWARALLIFLSGGFLSLPYALMEAQYRGGPVDREHKTLIFGDDFRDGCWNANKDNGNTTGSCSKAPLWHSSQMQGSHAGKVVDKVLETGTPARSQGKCMRFEWLRSRCTGTNTSKKAHLGSPCPPGPRHDRWYGFSLYLPANCGWENDQENTVIMQFHNIPDHHIGEKGIQPAMTFNMRGGDLSYGYWSDTNPNSSGNKAAKQTRKGPFTMAKLPINRWLDFVMHLKFDPWGKGAIEIWMNGEKIANRRNIALGLNNRVGANFSIGIYQHTGKSSYEKKVVYMDEVRIGNAQAGYELVAPRGSSPKSPDDYVPPDPEPQPEPVEETIDFSEPHIKLSFGATAQGWFDGDPFARGGAAFSFPASLEPGDAEGAGPAEMYESVRHNPDGAESIGFHFPDLADGKYLLRFHVTDLYGGRAIDITASGKKVVEDLDPITEGGGEMRPVVKEAQVSVTGGTGLEIVLSDDRPEPKDVFLSGLEIIAASSSGTHISPRYGAFAHVPGFHRQDMRMILPSGRIIAHAQNGSAARRPLVYLYIADTFRGAQRITHTSNF